LLTLLLAGLLLPGCAVAEPSRDARGTATVIRGAFLIDPADGGPPWRADVRIDNGRIAEIRDPAEPSKAERGQDSARVIEADGRFLLPGFIDTHAHVALGPVGLVTVDGAPSLQMTSDPEVPRRSLISLLAHGITTVRDPGGPTEALVRLRSQLERSGHEGDRIDGPRLRVAGAVIDRQAFDGLTDAVEGPEAVRDAVRRQAEAGVDWIKLYTQLSRVELRAGIEEAHRQGLPAVAHLQRISWTEAAGMGLDALVHAVPGSELLLPERVREAYLPDFLGTRFLYSWFEHVELDSPEIRDMLEALREAEVTLDLTLVAFEGMVRGDQSWRTREDRDLRWAAPGLVENWRTLFTFNVGWTPGDFERARRAWPKALAFSRLLYESGIELTVGTDANNPWTVAGPSFHRELELLSEAGVPAGDILRMATHNGARALGLADRTGSLKKGYDADLVLLERNPLDDISATREIAWVMRSGRLYQPEELLGRIENPAPDGADAEK
ncbi:MAG: amidohydrolase family protein, partial [Holophagales bacterium]|nr:amidohydrolase family protein [Holophagales bacterium]